jgi:cytochrome c5
MHCFKIATPLVATACCLAFSALAREGSDWRDDYYAHGKRVYDDVCADCHNEGKDGAPVIGDRQAWSDRSPLWSAVLLEHAKAGWLQMPAKGGQSKLSDQDVEAAGEYLLTKTFPEKPRD